MSQPPPFGAFETLFKAANQQKQEDNKNPDQKKQEPSMVGLLPPVKKSQRASKKDIKSQYENQIFKGVNQVLQYQFKNGKKVTKSFYVPSYIRLKVNRVSEINYIEGSAGIQTEIRLWLMIKDFPKEVQEQILNLAQISINQGKSTHKFIDIPEPPKLDSSYKQNVSKKALGFLIVEGMQLDIESDPFYSPFELVNLVANLQIKKITLGEHNPDYLEKITDPAIRAKYEGATVQFNFMDAHPFLNFSFGEVNHLGSFDIAESLVDMEFSNVTIKSDEEQEPAYSELQQNRPLHLGGLVGKVLDQTIGLKQKVKLQKLKKGTITPQAFQHGRILIPLYKYPAMTLINIFVPFYMVAILNLGVFFEANDMSNRSASIATFQLAYIAFFPTVRQTLPQTPKLVFAEILIYIQALSTLILFFYSLDVNMKEDYVFTWYSDPTFLVCLALTALNMGITCVQFIIHKACWQPAYNKLPDGAVQCMAQPTLDTDDCEQWWNQACEEQFEPAMQLQLVKPAFPHKKKKKVVNPLQMLFGANKGQKNQVHPEG